MFHLLHSLAEMLLTWYLLETGADSQVEKVWQV